MTTTEPPTSGTTREVDELRSATRAEALALAVTSGGDGSDLDAVETVDLGPARPLPARSGPATGVFVVDTGDRRLGDHQLASLRLAARPEGGEPNFPLVEVIAWEGSQLLVEAELTVDEMVGPTGDAGCALLRLVGEARTAPATRELYERFSSGAGLGLGAGLLAAVRNGPEAAAAPAGLGVIVGPASRRQQTLVRALEQLVEAERSVLVVSSDAAALDRLVLAADRAMGGRAPGTILRVGPASTRRVGGEPRLTVSGAAASRQPDLLRRLHQVARELRTLLSEGKPPALRGGPTTSNLSPAAPANTASRPPAAGNGSADAGSADRSRDDTPAVRQAVRQHLERARDALHGADSAVAAAVDRAASASTRHTAARQAVRALEGSRTLHNLVDELVRRTEEAARDVAASAAGVGRLAAEPDQGRQLLVAAEVAATRLDRRDRALAELEDARARAADVPDTRAAVTAADQALAEARAAHAAAERAALRARADRARAVRVVGELTRRLDGPRGADAPALTTSAAIVGRIGAPPSALRGRSDPSSAGSGRAGQGGTDRRADHDGAGRRADGPDVAARVARLRAEYRQVRRELTAHGPDAIRAARVVVTTFDGVVSDPAIYERTFDNVLVDHAGRVPAAFLVWAASRAGRALTLAGEAAERPPAPAVDEGALPPEEYRWLASNLLELVGLATVDAVARHPSGIVLG